MFKTSLRPKHIAFNVKDAGYWADINSVSVESALESRNKRLIESVDFCIKNKILIFTFNLSQFHIENFAQNMDSIVDLLNNLADNPLVHDKRIKVSVLGKWYDLPSKVVDAIKTVVDKTADHDQYFLNLCLNYDGQEEILNSLRIILRSIQYEKIAPDQLSKQLVKDNLYSSYYIPPDLIVNTHDHTTNGFLLWDSHNSKHHFSKVEFNDLDKKELKKALDFYQDN
ncbi:hypothetical protein HN592_05610 [Candidatus Woesearchaeota archaeon]|jgi:undecaprenyl diphosphate synthase|nr:hypothetical protein [Candidatus Woesearchaeota archaeon]MBT3304734.1 hypothetical protein [Candidatus Woesearchaeota archaeon]MBT4367930.1 hypothetical protein [Candidatus Woesearchaeota archaeon]MBT4712418.1 hypothetical protein [Candidatus Woesearchaeota archaeon]MBT6639330.1 hypothetical protein [Candidatus Woesearchaeota archaeon]